ncbi:hypothetical protein NPIL_213801 [Nephila pilipes]|uniref:Uncharacterized protein n=1 Tax=Nephila pilipes TaxID=299642 RepID=A0A8X6P870_NEPPI|nr:hypothetical protein NPIL_213801 [Nephila pilipes]
MNQHQHFYSNCRQHLTLKVHLTLQLYDDTTYSGEKKGIMVKTERKREDAIQFFLELRNSPPKGFTWTAEKVVLDWLEYVYAQGHNPSYRRGNFPDHLKPVGPGLLYFLHNNAQL